MNSQTTVRKSSRAKRRESKQNKEAVDYDSNPPRCENCIHRVKEHLAIPGKRVYSPAYCKPGGFVVTPVGICNNWNGRDGSKLESSIQDIEK